MWRAQRTCKSHAHRLSTRLISPAQRASTAVGPYGDIRDRLRSTPGSPRHPGRRRPLCPYPQTSIYNGEGSTDDAASFTCGGNVQALRVACNDMRTVYKQENTATLDFKGVGLTAEECAESL